MTTKIVKKKLQRKEEIMENVEVEKVSRNLYYSGYCLTDFYNFAEFGIGEKPSVSEDIQIKKFEFKKEQLSYILGSKISKIDIKNDITYFDGKKDRTINKVFLDYFRNKYQKCEFYWIANFNKKEKDYEMVGIVLDDDLKGLLKLNKIKEKE